MAEASRAGLIDTSIRGRRLGLQRLSTTISGGSRGETEYLVGPLGFLADNSTANSTGTNVHPSGVQHIPSTSAGSSAVYTIDPPVPGCFVFISGTTDGPVYLKTANSETIITTAGSSFTTVTLTSLGGSFGLFGLTTAQWGSFGLTTGTSSQASGFALTTST
jgi:hypothetical protein